jgi:hypothetical protein
MSKLAFIKRYNYAPAAGGILGDIWNIGKGLFGKKKAAATVTPQITVGRVKGFGGIGAGSGVGIMGYDPITGASRLTGGGGGYRRGKGITARELRGFRKVSRLLHREGMVPKRKKSSKLF